MEKTQAHIPVRTVMNTTDLPQLIVSQIQIMGCEVQVLAPYGRPIIWSILGKSSCHHNNNNEKDEKNQSQDQEILLTFMILMKTYRFFLCNIVNGAFLQGGQ